jgi:hypothetical protein
MAEGKAANEDGDTGKDGIEEVEGSHGAHTNEVEERPFHSQVSEWLVQALKDSVRATLLLWFVWHSFLDLGAGESGWVGRYTPQSQLKTFTAITAMPVPAATPASAFFAPGSPCANP